jgi:uncharacterized protein
LLLASELGHDDIVRRLLAAGASVNLPNGRGATALMFAASRGHAPVVQTLLRAGGEPALVSKHGNTALISAIVGEDMEVFRTVLPLVPVDVGPVGRTPLIMACERRQEEMVKMLLEAGADPNQHDGRGRPVLHYAIAPENPALVELLLSGGASASCIDASAGGRSALHIVANAFEVEAAVAIMQSLLDRGADPRWRDVKGRTPLHEMAMNGRCELAEVLLAWKADVNARDAEQCTPLMFAVKHMKVPMMDLLADNGADLDAVDSGFRTLEEIARRARGAEWARLVGEWIEDRR